MKVLRILALLAALTSVFAGCSSSEVGIEDTKKREQAREDLNRKAAEADPEHAGTDPDGRN